MSNGNGPLDFEATLDATKLNSMLHQTEMRIKGMADATVKEADRMDRAFNKVGMLVGGYFSATFGAKIVSDIARVRGEFQQLEIAFETILKNKEKSDQLMREITDFAAKTPFDLKQVASGAKQLLAYGEASEEVIGTMRKLGDIASGLSIPFGDLVYLYGTSRTQGKLMTKDLMQFAGRGIPIIDELSKVLQVSKSRVLEMASESKIGFEHLETVIKNLTSSTGMFGGMMEKQAKSLPGLISNLGDAWDRMLNDIGKDSEQTFADAIKLATTLVENYQKFIDILKVVILTYGSYKAAVVLQTIAMNGYGKALGFVIAKEKLLAILSKKNPWGLILAGITAVVSALVIFNKKSEETISIQDELAAKSEERLGKEKQALDALFSTLKRTTSSQKQRASAITEINSKYGSYLKNLLNERSSAKDIADAYDAINNSLKDNIEITLKREKILELGRQRDSALNEYNRIKLLSGSDYAKEVGKVEGISGAVRKEALARLADEWAMANNQFNNLVLEVQDILDNKNKKVEEIITPSDKTVKSFEEKLEEVKKSYQNYYKWLEHYGKESANSQFENLVKGGESYLAYLNNQISSLESKKRSPQDDSNLISLLTSKDELTGVKSSLDSLQEKTEKAKGSFADLIDYISFLDEQLASIENDGSEASLQKLTFLQQALDNAKKELISTSKETYNTLLEQSKDFKIKRENVEKEYQQTIKNLDKDSLGAHYDEAVKIANDIKEEKLKAINEEEVKQSEAYKKLATDLENLNRNQIRQHIKALEKELSLLDTQDSRYKLIKAVIDDANNHLKKGFLVSTEEISQALAGASDIIGSFDEKLANSVELASNLASAFNKFASGDKIGGIVQIASSLFSYLSTRAKIREQEDDERDQARLEANKKLIDSMNDSLEIQLKLIDELTGTDKLNQYSATLQQLAKNINTSIEKMESLDELVMRHSNGRISQYNVDLPSIDISISGLGTYDKINKINDAVETLESSMNSLNNLIDSGKLQGDDLASLEEYLQAYSDDIETLKEIQQSFFAEVTGTTYDSILDGLVSAFDQGLTSAEYFATSFEEMMRKALLQSLSINALQGPIEDWYSAFADATSDGVLSKDEITQLRETLNQIFQNGEEYAQMLEEAAGISLGSTDAKNEDKLASAVKGINQQTAGLIAGYMNAIRMNQAQSLIIMNKKLESLMKIENNTFINSRFTRLIYEHLQAHSSNNNLPSTRISG